MQQGRKEDCVDDRNFEWMNEGLHASVLHNDNLPESQVYAS
jgi:hypothetical protein